MTETSKTNDLKFKLSAFDVEESFSDPNTDWSRELGGANSGILKILVDVLTAEWKPRKHSSSF